MKHIFTLTISQGLEDILSKELKKLQFQRVTPESGAVRSTEQYEMAIGLSMVKNNLRVLLRLTRFQIQSAEDPTMVFQPLIGMNT